MANRPTVRSAYVHRRDNKIEKYTAYRRIFCAYASISVYIISYYVGDKL